MTRATGGRTAAIGLVLSVLMIAAAVRDSSPAGQGAERVGLQVPAGFRITVFATGLGAPRMMALDPAGTLLVSIPSQGRVVALPGRGTAETTVTVIKNLNLPHGL